MATLEAISKTSERARERACGGVRGALAPRVETEHGAALICALMGMTILMALGAALVADHLHRNDHRWQFPEQHPGVLRGRSGRRTRGCGIAHAHALDRSRRGYRTIAVHRRRAGRRARASDGCACRPDGCREHCQLRRARAVRRRGALAAFRLRAPSGSGALWRLRLRRSTSWRSSPGARQNRARPSSRFGARPSVRAGPTRPSKSPSPERTPAKPSSCGPSSVDKRLAEDGPSKTVARGRRASRERFRSHPIGGRITSTWRRRRPARSRGPRAVQAIP